MIFKRDYFKIITRPYITYVCIHSIKSLLIRFVEILNVIFFKLKYLLGQKTSRNKRYQVVKGDRSLFDTEMMSTVLAQRSLYE